MDRASQQTWTLKAADRNRSRVSLTTMALLLGVSTSAWAQGVDTREVEKTLELKRSELNQTEERAKAIQKDVADIDQEREKINARLLETAALIQKSEAQLSNIEARLGELEAQEKLLNGSLEQNQDQIARLLGALQRMGRNPPPVLITRREDALEMVRSAMVMATAFPELRDEAEGLITKLDDLNRVMTGIRTEGDKLKAETVRLTDARTRLAGLMTEKKQSIAERHAELAKVQQAASDISKNVTDLNELIQKLDQTVTENTGLAAYEKETQTAAAEPSATAPPAGALATPPTGLKPGTQEGVPQPGAPDNPSVASTPPAASPQPTTRVVELAPSASGLALANPGRIKPAIPFHEAQGRLPMPAQGRRVIAFSDKTQFGGQSKGIVLETRQFAQVVSPSDGWVVYAGEFRSYGQLLIINAGGGYHILLAGLSQIDVQVGQFVLAAEPVGTMSGSAQPAGDQQSSAPVLYIEFRKDGRPVDPDPWWISNSQQKVQG